MFPLKIETIAPYLRDKTRLFLLHGSQMTADVDNEWVMRHLNNYLGAVEQPTVYQVHSNMINRPYPELTRDRTTDPVPPSDVLLKDTSRQHKGIEERYHKLMMPIDDIWRIAEPTFKWHWASSRGLEREVVGLSNKLESESVNRRTLKPLML